MINSVSIIHAFENRNEGKINDKKKNVQMENIDIKYTRENEKNINYFCSVMHFLFRSFQNEQ